MHPGSRLGSPIYLSLSPWAQPSLHHLHPVLTHTWPQVSLQSSRPQKAGWLHTMYSPPSSSLASSVRVGRFHGAILSPTGQHPGLPSLFSTALTSMSAHSWTLVPWLPGRVILNFYRSPEHVTYGLWQGCKGRRENPSRELAFAFPPTARLRCSQVLELLSKAVFLSHFSGCG